MLLGILRSKQKWSHPTVLRPLLRSRITLSLPRNRRVVSFVGTARPQNAGAEKKKTWQLEVQLLRISRVSSQNITRKATFTRFGSPSFAAARQTFATTSITKGWGIGNASDVSGWLHSLSDSEKLAYLYSTQLFVSRYTINMDCRSRSPTMSSRTHRAADRTSSRWCCWFA